MNQSPPDALPRTGLANVLRNLAWLLGGKGFAAVCSLIYLAVLSRSLGLRDFGHFSLIFATAQSLVALTGFQTWQTIVRFGAGPVLRGEWAQFGRLAWLCAVIDVAGAATGTLVAGLVFFVLAGVLGLNPAYVEMAFWFNCALLWSRLTTPTGIVRVLDRFDVGSYVESVVPLGRLIASGVIVATGPSVAKFLLAWALFDLLAAGLYWLAAWRLAPQALGQSHPRQWRMALAENPGITGFFGITYLSSSFEALTRHGPLFLVGWFLGTSAGGLYRLADQLAQGVKLFSGLVVRAVFPVLAVSQMAEEAQAFARLVWQVARMAAMAGIIVTLAALFLGEELLVLIGGNSFAVGAPVLLPLAIGAAFELASVSCEPALFSTGHAAAALRARALSVVVLAGAVMAMLLAGHGPTGAGWGVAAGMAVFYVAMTLTLWITMRRMRRAVA